MTKRIKPSELFVELAERKDKNHGGKRPNSGRKRGRKSVSSSITMPIPDWQDLDELRGALNRSAWVRERVKLAKWVRKRAKSNPEAIAGGL